LPTFVDRRRLVVDEAGLEPDPLHGVEVEIGLDHRRLLRPGDPEAVRGRERGLQDCEASRELLAAR
jgi:hypothetical protein